MKIICGTILLMSVTFSAQEKKTDSLKRSYFFKPELMQKHQISKDSVLLTAYSNTLRQPLKTYKMLVVKPKDTIVYSSLKDSYKDHSKYKTLNSISPEKLKKDIEK